MGKLNYFPSDVVGTLKSIYGVENIFKVIISASFFILSFTMYKKMLTSLHLWIGYVASVVFDFEG